ncbi:MAG: sulfite reductase subunit alpha [Pirellula sp.]|nr:sulfite reductase subunit alpha [Pirellula sp.]
MTVSLIPESAPFSHQQRAWLNGFFAALLNTQSAANGDSSNGAASNGHATSSVALVAAPLEEVFPWHDPALPIDERLSLAVDRPIERKLMSAMAQLNCGACGYLCQTYGEAIARGEEQDLTRCTPGGGDTAKMLKKLMTERSATETSTPSPESKSANGQAHNGDGHATTNGATAAPVVRGKPAEAAQVGVSRNLPYAAVLVENRRLTHVDAPKDTRHVVIDLGDSGLRYEPGDSLGVLPVNCPQLVDAVLRALGATGAESVTLGEGRRKPLRQALASEFQLTRCRPLLWEMLAKCGPSDEQRIELQALASGDDAMGATADVCDALERFPNCRPSVEQFVAALGKLQPRLYSISSSQSKHPDQVHLTIGVVQFESLGKQRHGVASHYLGVRSNPGDPVHVFFQKSRFRLPASDDAPIIMVGPGTGIAPFRAFLEEREARAAKGRNWLLFGNQYIDYDFLYREELDAWCDSDLLTRLDIAFSRDGAKKVYVQDRMRENGAELWDWLQSGAHFYVCGDAKRMAADVDAALRDIISREGGLSADEAKCYSAELQKAGRYQKDVY